MESGEAEDVRSSAKALYSDGQVIWDESDPWNRHKKRGIEAFVEDHCRPIIRAAQLTLNAGSGGERYAWMPQEAINVDLFVEQVRQLPCAAVADVCSLPFADGTFDLSICVGSVLNYAPLMETLIQLSRSLKRGGHLILHFESSSSFEQLFTKNWNQSVTRIGTVNSGRPDTIWVYSPRFVADTLRSFGLIVQKTQSFHIASAFASRLGIKQYKAAGFEQLDRWLKIFSSLADDQIILAEKVS